MLEAAGIRHAEALVALTANDSANIVAARIARHAYRVPRVLARLHDPAHAQAYRELGIATIGSVPTTVNRVVQLLHHLTLEPHQTFGNGETLLVRSRIPDYLGGRQVAELNVPGEIGVVELSRHGHSRIPEPTTPLEPGDVLSFIVAAGSIGRLRSFLDRRRYSLPAQSALGQGQVRLGPGGSPVRRPRSAGPCPSDRSGPTG
jgi:trk system potassium uptake protein